MLSNELMGLLALAIVWVNTLLVVAAAGRELSALAAQRRWMRPLAPGEVGAGRCGGGGAGGGAGAGGGGRHHGAPVGRQAADDHGRRAILFADRAYRGEVLGGELSAGDVTLAVAAAADAEVWLPAEELRAAAACPGEGELGAAYAEAKKARGFSRTVTVDIGPGARVFVAGEVRRGDGFSIHPLPGARLLVSTVDPRAVCGRHMGRVVLFMIAVPVIAAACTAVALYPPHFGLVSTLGGALCLAYFLLVQPAGTALRDAVLLPHRAILRGSWVSSKSAEAGDAAPEARPARSGDAGAGSPRGRGEAVSGTEAGERRAAGAG